MALTEYRLQDLARVSGVSARNIRAYRERGLLDPPRRQGRSAFYDAHHLAQLQTINALLARGFTSAHIADFFDVVRTGGSLAEFLGLRRAVLQPRPTPGGQPLVGIDPHSAEGMRLVASGLAQRSGAGLVFTDDAVDRVIARSDDPRGDARIVLELLDATGDHLAALIARAEGVLQRAAPVMRDEMAGLIVDRVSRALRRRPDVRP